MRKLNQKSVLGLCAAGVLVGLACHANAAIVIDDGTSTAAAFTAPGVTSTGSWAYRTETQHGGTYNDTGLHFAFGANDTATYTASIPTSGLWSLESHMTNNTLNNSSDVAIALSRASGTQNLTIRQNVTGATDQWMSLGIYNLNAGNNTYVLTSGTSNTATDAVRWSQIGVDTPTAFVVDSLGAGVRGFYAESGTWASSTIANNLYGNADRFSNALGSVATTTAPVELALYDISVTWKLNDSRATNALIRVTDADGTITDLRVNQKLAPTGGGTEFGVTWQSLGTYAFNSTSTVQVIYDALANNFVASDGVRFTYVSPVPEPASLGLLALAGMLVRRRR